MKTIKVSLREGVTLDDCLAKLENKLSSVHEHDIIASIINTVKPYLETLMEQGEKMASINNSFHAQKEIVEHGVTILIKAKYGKNKFGLLKRFFGVF